MCYHLKKNVFPKIPTVILVVYFMLTYRFFHYIFDAGFKRIIENGVLMYGAGTLADLVICDFSSYCFSLLILLLSL